MFPTAIFASSRPTETDSPYEKSAEPQTTGSRARPRTSRFGKRRLSGRVSRTKSGRSVDLPATFGSAYSDVHDGRYHHLRPHCGEGARRHAPHARHRARRGRARRVHLRRLFRCPQDDERRFRAGRSRAADRRRPQVPRVVRPATRKSARILASRTRACPFLTRARLARPDRRPVVPRGPRPFDRTGFWCSGKGTRASQVSPRG